jgi:hypothetical protein
MNKRRFSEEQSVRILRKAEAAGQMWPRWRFLASCSPPSWSAFNGGLSDYTHSDTGSWLIA